MSDLQLVTLFIHGKIHQVLKNLLYNFLGDIVKNTTYDANPNYVISMY